MSDELKPVLLPDGSLHQYTISIEGNFFFCECGCNVFHKPDDRNLNKYKCNSCGRQAVMPETYENLQKERDQLKAELTKATQVSLGVGNGSGNLFVHGSFEAIKTCQEKLLLMEELKAEVERLREVLVHAEKICTFIPQTFNTLLPALREALKQSK